MDGARIMGMSAMHSYVLTATVMKLNVTTANSRSAALLPGSHHEAVLPQVRSLTQGPLSRDTSGESQWPIKP